MQKQFKIKWKKTFMRFWGSSSSVHEDMAWGPEGDQFNSGLTTECGLVAQRGAMIVRVWVCVYFKPICV